jgi:uncharacterized MAPEG superfamily protein
VLGLNLLLLANNTALSRARAHEAVNPEDLRMVADAAVVYEGGNALTQRYRRAHRNALENVVPFLVTGLLLPVLGTPFAVAAPLYAVFVGARVAHSVAYLYELQPWRTLSFGVGALAQLGVLAVVAVTVVAGAVG